MTQLRLFIVMLVVFVGLGLWLSCEAGVEDISLKVERVSDNVVVVSPGYPTSNVTAIATQRGIVVVDTHHSPGLAERIKEKIEEMVITISQKVGEESKLYGSVTSMDIAAQLEKQGIAIDRRKISLDKPIKALGEYEVPVRLYPEVTGSIKVVVVPEE